MSARFAGSDWLKEAGVKTSPLGTDVADIVGQVWRGIYHLPDISKRNWSAKSEIKLPVRGSLATFDGAKLTELVVLCHDSCIRMEIAPCNGRCLYLSFTRREGRRGCRDCVHPATIQHVREIREAIGFVKTEEDQ